ncbi:MAG: hypothetical protein WCR42_04545 [bacterium]
MKRYYMILMLLVITGVSVSAKKPVILPPATTPDLEINKDEAVLRIQDFQTNIQSKEDQARVLDAKIKKAQEDLKKANIDLKDCDAKILALIGATNEDIEAYRQSLGVIDGKIRQLQRLNNDQLADSQDQVKALEAELNVLRLSKIACIQEFYDKVIVMARDIRGLYREKKIKSYTVGTWAENRDCLWNIASKTEIYNDPMLWPKIWQNNKNLVKNPDVIFPGQVLLLPEKADKTTDEIKAERKYWRMKKQAAADAAAVPAGK